MDLNRIKQKQQESKGGSGFKFKEGPNNIRVFWFRHAVTKSDVASGFFPKSELDKKQREIDRPLTVHFTGEKGRPVLSNPKLMAKYDAVLSSDGEEAARKIAPTLRYAVNLVDMDEKPRKMRQPMIPKTVYNKILGKMANEDFKGIIADVEVYGAKLIGLKGRDFIVTYNPKAPGAGKYEVDIRDKEMSAVLDEALLAQVKDLYSPEGWKAIGVLEQAGAKEEEAESTEDTDKEEESEDEEKPKKGSKSEDSDEEKDEESTEKEESSETSEEDDDEKPAKGKKKSSDEDEKPAKGKAKDEEEE